MIDEKRLAPHSRVADNYGKGETVYRVTRENGQSVVKDANDNILVRCSAGDDGGMTLVDAQGKVLHAYSTAQVEAFTMR